MDDAKKAAMLAELDRYAAEYPIVQEGDVTCQDIAERYGVSQPIVYMRRVIELAPDAWEMVQVVDRPGSRRWFWVLRKRK